MIKSLTSLAILGLLGTATIVLPGLAPPSAAGETVVLAKADRLGLPTVSRDCSQQVWPSFDAHCLRSGETGSLVHEARLVTARR
jgi:hypothetical protein